MTPQSKCSSIVSVCVEGRIDDGFLIYTHKNYILLAGSGVGSLGSFMLGSLQNRGATKKNQKCLSKGATCKKERKANEAEEDNFDTVATIPLLQNILLVVVLLLLLV